MLHKFRTYMDTEHLAVAVAATTVVVAVAVAAAVAIVVIVVLVSVVRGQSKITRCKLHNHIHTCMIPEPDDTLLSVATETKAHRPVNGTHDYLLPRLVQLGGPASDIGLFQKSWIVWVISIVVQCIICNIKTFWIAFDSMHDMILCHDDTGIIP